MDKCREEFGRRFPDTVWEGELDGLSGEDLVFAGWKAAWDFKEKERSACVHEDIDRYYKEE
jgi:hypothetical protein